MSAHPPDELRDEAAAPLPPGRHEHAPRRQRRHHRHRVLRWVLFALGAIVVVIGCLLWFGLASERAARRLIALGLAKSGGTVRIGAVSGTLAGPLVLRDVAVRSPSYAATIDSVLFNWSPTGLLHKQVRIDRLHAVGVHVVLPDTTPTKTDTTPPQRPRLPMDVVLGDVLVQRLSLVSPTGLVVERGVARLDGHADAYRLVATAAVSLPSIKDLPLVLHGRGDLEHLALDNTTLALLDGRVAARGTVGWWPVVNWDLVATAAGIRPALMLADTTAWPGAIMARGTTAGQMDSTGPQGRVVIDTLGGTLRGQPLGGHATVDLAGTVYRIPELGARWGSATLAASGTVADTLDLFYRLAVRDLRTAMPAARGALDAEGRVGGPRTAALVHTTFRGRDLAYGTNRLATLGGRADVGLAPDGRTDVDARAERVRAGTQVIDSIVFAMRGTRPDHRATALAAAPVALIELAARGGLDSTHWRGRLLQAGVRTPTAGTWRLEQPVAVSAGAAAATVAPLCLRATSGRDTSGVLPLALVAAVSDTTNARLCASGAWYGPRGWRAAATLERLPLALADTLLPKGRSLLGTIGGRLDASAVGTRLDARFHLAASGAALRYTDADPLDTLPRRLTLDTAAVDGHMGRDGVVATLALHLSGDSGGLGHLAGRFTMPGYTRTDLPLRRQAIRARLDGRLDNLAFLETLTRAVDSLVGRVVLAVGVDGTVGAPHIDGGIQLQDFHAWLPAGRAAEGAVALTLNATVRSDSTLDADLELVPRGVFYDYLLDTIPQRVAVDSGAIRVHAGADGVRGVLALRLSDAARHTRLASLGAQLTLPQYTRLGLAMDQQPLRVRVLGDIPDLAFARPYTPGVDSLAGRLTLTGGADGTVAAPTVTGALRVTDLVARLGQGTRVTGGVDGDLAAAVRPDSSFDASLRLLPRAIVFDYPAPAGRQRMALDTTGLVLRAGQDGVHGALDLRLLTLGTPPAPPSGAPLGVLTGRLDLPQYIRRGQPLDSQPLAASLLGRLDDLSVVRAFTGMIDSVQGRLTLDARVAGTVGDPRQVGGLHLHDAAAFVPLAGIHVRDVQLDAVGDTSGAIAVTGRMRSGGVLTLQGRTPLRSSPATPGTIAIRGDSVELMNTEQVHAIVSPHLDVVLAGDSTDVRGDVALPYVSVHLAEIPVTAVPPNDDIVFTDTLAAGPAAAKQRLAARVRVVLGDSVAFSGFNFTAQLGGALLVTQLPERTATASGSIVIREGHYKAYGQDLTITNGQVRFAGGPVDDPGLAIRASRTAEDSTVAGLDISGTLKQPRVTIFSQPPMSENRALEYIALGHPLGQSSGSQGNLVSKAASSLGLRGGNLLARTVGRGIGLDQAGIQTQGDLKQASFVAGKYLSPNLYVSYGIGLFEPISTIRLRYVLSRQWTLQAERGEATGGDLLYRVEKGR